MKKDQIGYSRRDVLKKGAITTGALVLGGTAASGTAAAGIGDGRVLDYHLNNINYDRDRGEIVSNFVHDASPADNDGVWKGDAQDPVVKDGAVGNAFEFTKGDQILVLDSQSLDGMSDLTVAAWFKFPKTTGEDMVVVGKRLGYEFVVDGRDRVESDLWWAVDNGEGDWKVNDGNITLNEDTWHHVALVSDSDNDEIRLYKDGSREFKKEGTGDVAVNDSDLGIGKRGDGFGPFTGKIDEARVYNRALSDAAVTELYEMRD